VHVIYFPLQGIELQLAGRPTRRLVAKGYVIFSLRTKQPTTSSAIPPPPPPRST
jgi:hypothetical protein